MVQVTEAVAVEPVGAEHVLLRELLVGDLERNLRRDDVVRVGETRHFYGYRALSGRERFPVRVEREPDREPHIAGDVDEVVGVLLEIRVVPRRVELFDDRLRGSR